MSRPNLDTTKPTCAPLNVFERKGRYNAFNVKGTLRQVMSRLNRTRPNLNTKTRCALKEPLAENFQYNFGVFEIRQTKRGFVMKLFLDWQGSYRVNLTAGLLWKLPLHYLPSCDSSDAEAGQSGSGIGYTEQRWTRKKICFPWVKNIVTNSKQIQIQLQIQGLMRKKNLLPPGDTGWISGTLQWWFRATGGNGWVRLPSSHY